MALEITGDIKLKSGVELTSVYARINPTLTTSGVEIRTIVSYWLNVNSFNNGDYPLDFSPSLSFRYEYDREVEGTDLLFISSEKIKAELEDLGYSVVITDI